MRTVRVEKLSADEFLPFGVYANYLNPRAEKIGAAPIEFFRDMAQQTLGEASNVSFSTCLVKQRPLIIDVTEYHSKTGEGILPLDNDVLMHVAPATPADGQAPLDKIRVFSVPQGTLVVLRPGVWHHAPFTVNSTPTNVLIVLPERTYANDCVVVNLAEENQIKIVR